MNKGKFVEDTKKPYRYFKIKSLILIITNALKDFISMFMVYLLMLIDSFYQN